MANASRHRRGLPIARRFFYSVHRRWLRAFSPRFSTRERMGALFLLDQLNLVDRTLWIRGAWESEQIDFLGQLIADNQSRMPKMVFLDVGAHAALYSILMANAFAFDKIVAYEPLPENLAQLRANLFINGFLDRVAVVEKAVGDHVGTASFIGASDRNRGVSRLASVKEPVAASGAAIDVAVTRIDVDFKTDNALIVAKIDVEGGELDANNSFILQVECNDARKGELHALMSSHGCAFVKAIEEDHYFTRFSTPA
jgi:FkbM family methyltransferase